MFIETNSLFHFFSLRRSEMFILSALHQLSSGTGGSHGQHLLPNQAVFAVGGREWLIKPAVKEELYKYMTGIIRNQKQKLIAINGMPDHVHILIGLRPAMALADLIQQIKVAQRISSTNESSCTVASIGRKVMVHSRTGIHNWIVSSVTFKTKRSIMTGTHSRVNTCLSSGSSILGLKNNTSLN